MRSVRVLEYQLMLSGACSSAAEHSSDTGLAARELESARDQPTERVILRFRLSLSLSLSAIFIIEMHMRHSSRHALDRHTTNVVFAYSGCMPRVST